MVIVCLFVALQSEESGGTRLRSFVRMIYWTADVLVCWLLSLSGIDRSPDRCRKVESKL